MACIRYVVPDFKRPQLQRIAQINRIIDEYLAMGLRMTLRQLYYQLVSRNIVLNNEKSYKNTGNLVSRARLAGLIDWDAIEDRGRIPNVPYHPFRKIDDSVEVTARGFMMDRWRGQDTRVEVWIEKQALSGIFAPICREHDIALVSNKGYTSQSALKDSADRVLEYEVPVTVLYFGDHDPSGLDMVRDITDRLDVFGVHNVTVEKVALTWEQIKHHNPPPNYAKVTDSRFKKYVEEYGEECWELDALRPDTLSELVDETVKTHIDAHTLAHVMNDEHDQRASLMRYVNRPFKHKRVAYDYGQ
jgi:hypothetical protein